MMTTTPNHSTTPVRLPTRSSVWDDEDEQEVEVAVHDVHQQVQSKRAVAAFQQQQLKNMNIEELYLDLASSQDAFAKDSLFVRMGREVAVINMVRQFYELVLDDPILYPSFVEFTEFKTLQVEFLTLLFGNKFPKQVDLHRWLLESYTAWFAKVDSDQADLAFGYVPEACEALDFDATIIEEIMNQASSFAVLFDPSYRKECLAKAWVDEFQERLEPIAPPTTSRRKAPTRSSSGEGLLSMTTSTMRSAKRAPPNRSSWSGEGLTQMAGAAASRRKPPARRSSGERLRSMLASLKGSNNNNNKTIKPDGS